MSKDCFQRKNKPKERANFVKQKSISSNDSEAESENYSENKSFEELGFLNLKFAAQELKTRVPPCFEQEGENEFPARNPPKMKYADKAKKCIIAGVEHKTFTPNTWFGDSCASCSIDNDASGMYDIKEICEKIDGIGGQQILATKVSKKRCFSTKLMEKLWNGLWIQSNIVQIQKKD